MPRRPRHSPPGVPLHIVQRGTNKQSCFRRKPDYVTFLAGLREMTVRYDVQVHAYALMTNHVHLLVTPMSADGASRMMQQLGRKYVQYFNYIYERSGTLWEGRFKSAAIQSDRYLLACHRYIEMNPVRAGLAQSPHEYLWTSYRANALGQADPLVTPHQLWIELGRNHETRQAAYLRLFDQIDIDASDELIRTACRRNSPL